MNNSQLYLTLRKLDKSDCDAVAELASCSFFNKKPEIERLCRYLARHIAVPDGRLFAKEKVFKAAFPGQPFNDAKLRLAMSAVLKLVERYLAIRQMESDDSDRELYLLQALRSRGLESVAERHMKRCCLITMEKRPNRLGF